MKKHRWWSLALLLVILVLAMVAFAPVALAATGDTVGVESPQQLLLVLVSIAVPFVTGILMRKSYPSWLKALLTAVLAVGIGVATVYATGGWAGGAWLIVVACYTVAQTTFTQVIARLPKVQAWLYGFFNADLVAP
jgi:hypothetical protein